MRAQTTISDTFVISEGDFLRFPMGEMQLQRLFADDPPKLASLRQWPE